MVRFQPPTAAAGRHHDEHMDTDASDADSDDERTIRAHSAQSAGAKQRAASSSASASASRRRGLGGFASDSEDDSAMQLPLRGHAPNTAAIARHNAEEATKQRRGGRQQQDEAEDEDNRENQWEEEQKYPYERRRARGIIDDAAVPSKPAVTAAGSSSARRRAAASERLSHMNDALLDEEEELLQRQALEAEESSLEGEEEADEDEVLARSHFAAPLLHTQRMQRPPPASALTSFLSSLPQFTRPSQAREYHPANPLAPAAAAVSAPAAAPASRSVLEFHRHAFRAGWSSQGHMIVFAGGLDGRTVEFATVDALAVDANATQRAPVTAGPAAEVATVHHAPAVQSASDESAAAQARAQKRRAIQACLETHLAFHSYGAAGNPAQPSAIGAPNAGLLSSAQLFGAAGAGAPVTQTFAAPAFSTPFGFGNFAQAAPVASSSSTLTPFTRLCDAYIAALKGLIAASPSSNQSELELTLSTFQLLRCLYSKEEAEVRAPKLSRSMEALLRASNSAAPSDDLSVLTAQQDPYALQVGREAAFEQGWLQPTVTSTFVSPRVRALQQVAALVGGGSDGVSGTKMQEAFAYLIGHDIVRATEACLAAGNFRLATLLSQAGSFNYTGRSADDPDAPPSLESASRDLARQWASSWGNKDRGIHAFMPPDIQAVIKLMAGDPVVPSVPRLGSGDAPNHAQSLGWIEALGLHYWYVQPKSSNTNVGAAMLNYKTHAFAASAVVSKPFPPYSSYVPVSERRGAVSVAQSSPQQSRGVLEDDDDDDDMAQPSQALVLAGPSSSSASAASRLEFFDIRYGLLDLYTQQARNVNRVLSPQTHVPHVLDHHIAWHLFTTMQFTPLSEFGPHLPTLYMSYIHELELLSADAETQEGSSDLWKWAIYVALASPLPPLAAAMFDREAIIKQILMRHITYSRTHPFALPAGGRSSLVPVQNTPFSFQSAGSSFASVASKASLPTSLPILRADDQGFYSVSLNQDQSIGVTALSQRNPPADPTEAFLLNRLMIPAAWLHECKAIRAENAAEWSIACFHALHAGDIPSAYRLWESQLRDIWLLTVINRQEQLGVTAESEDINSLSTALLGLLQVFLSSAPALAGWGESGGLVLSFLEFRRNFASNLAHFTYLSTASGGGVVGLGESTSLQGHAERIVHFRAYQSELREFLATMDRMAGGDNNGRVGVASRSAHPHLAHLAWSKMSGAILAQLHAMQPLEEEMAAAEAAVPAAQRAASSSLSSRASVDVSAGELVSSADRLAVLSLWKDQFLAQYTAPAVDATAVESH